MRKLFLLILSLTSLVWATARGGDEGGRRTRWARLSGGNIHVCAIGDDGSLRCRGNNSAGQVGNGSFTTPVATPTQVVNLAVAPVSVAAGGNHTCVILARRRC